MDGRAERFYYALGRDANTHTKKDKFVCIFLCKSNYAVNLLPEDVGRQKCERKVIEEFATNVS
jgi:predicted lactoylglutathione lyase